MAVAIHAPAHIIAFSIHSVITRHSESAGTSDNNHVAFWNKIHIFFYLSSSHYSSSCSWFLSLVN